MNNSLNTDYPSEQQPSVIPQGHTPTLELTVEAFLRSLVGKNRSAQTIRAYRTDLGQFLGWLTETNGAVFHAGQVTKVDIAAYLSFLGQRHLAGVTRARKLAALREYFRFLEDFGAIAHSSASRIETPKREQRGRTFLRPDEYSRLLSQAGAHPRDFAILQLLLQTGLRVGELAALRMDDIDLVGKTLTIRAGKGMADRQLQLEHKALAALRSWLRLRGSLVSGDDHLFLNYQRHQPKPGTVTHRPCWPRSRGRGACFCLAGRQTETSASVPGRGATAREGTPPRPPGGAYPPVKAVC